MRADKETELDKNGRIRIREKTTTNLVMEPKKNGSRELNKLKKFHICCT